jgi:hypothetical protein
MVPSVLFLYPYFRMSSAGPSGLTVRPKIKAKRPSTKPQLPPLTGQENISLVEINRIYNHGYKTLLAPAKILEIFGPEVANSKKKRKAEIRKLIREGMEMKYNEAKMSDNWRIMTVNDLINQTELLLQQAVARVQAMSSPVAQASPPHIVGTKREANPAIAPVPMPDVAGPSQSVPKPSRANQKSKKQKKEKIAFAAPMEVIQEEEVSVDPFYHQMEVIGKQLRQLGLDKSRTTARGMEVDFNKAVRADENVVQAIENIKHREEMEKEKKAKKKTRAEQQELTAAFGQMDFQGRGGKPKRSSRT